MEQWLKFFLTGIIETAKTAIDTLHRIISLQNRLEKETIISLGKRIPNASALLQYLYKQPIVTASDIIQHLDITKPTAHTLLKNFTTLGILKEQTGYRRNRVFVFSDYLHLFNS
ncbi:IclR helix-turn-helix domain-containing protein [Chitinophaga costaii]|uniref:IclR helix-turn-helix domain-containing protein n=1 Tax=Chitinophaga costaii TaxID=1335309 RepID=A0A1C3Z371_9BACT|nr:helix-turn-helix domain-containing protein [Chitinophaga costaii]PUZ30212.1 MarR family transcriptional regulator [Chitinophaga costaii]SCB76786.1 IclR helix-turn-helix domain-containing protein [Chitinophaga costaii]